MGLVELAAQAVCRHAALTPLSSSSIRILAWLVGVAIVQGKFPVEVSYRQIRLGMQIGDITIHGTRCHQDTVRLAVDQLHLLGLITLDEGRTIAGGTSQLRITVKP